MLWVLFWCCKGRNKGPAWWAMCAVRFVHPLQVCVGRQWVTVNWELAALFEMDSLHRPQQEGLWGTDSNRGALPLQCSVLTCTDVLSCTLSLQQGWPKPDQKAGILFPMVSISWRDLIRSNFFLSVLASCCPRQRQMKKLWWMPDCFLPTSPLKGAIPIWWAGHCGSTFLCAVSGWRNALGGSWITSGCSLPRKAPVLLALLLTGRDGTTLVLSVHPLGSCGPALVPCGKVNLICFLIQLPVMYNNEYAAVHPQKWSDNYTWYLCQHVLLAGAGRCVWA